MGRRFAVFVPRILIAVTLVAPIGAMAVCGFSSSLSHSRPPACGAVEEGLALSEPSPDASTTASDGGPARDDVRGEPGDAVDSTFRGTVIEDACGHALDAFYESLAVVDRVGEPGALARISVFGDSHTAADLMTGQLRRRLQERFGDGGHGFVAAGRPWPSFRHRDVRVGASGEWVTLQALTATQAEDLDGRLGLAGVAVETEHPGAAVWAATAEEGPVGLTARRFEVHYLSRPEGGRFAVVLDGEQVARLSSRAAEPTVSAFATEADDGPHELRIEALGHGRIRLFGIVLERDGPGVVVDSLGLNGARITSVLAWDEAVFASSLAHRAPDLVVLWYGANSVGDDGVSSDQHELWITEALDRVRRAVPDASCLLVGPPDMARASLTWRGPEGTPSALASIVTAQRDAAALGGCGFFDTYEAMGGEGSSLRWASSDPPLLGADGIHFTAAGYDALADLLFDALIDGYARFEEAERQAAIAGPP